MSNFQAIGAVSSTLRAVLLDRMEVPPLAGVVPPLQVTIGPPLFHEDKKLQLEPAQVNIFLYRVVENGYIQNQEIQGQGSPSAYGHPPLSLNLHYLLTAYGVVKHESGQVFDETLAQQVLGSAMRVLHDIPIINDRLLKQTAPSGSPLLDANLLNDIERIKITLEPLNLEDITKVWTALALRFRLSVGYVVNVVRIQSQRARRFPRPVGMPDSAPHPPPPGNPPGPGPRIQVLLIQTPTITDLRVRRKGALTELAYAYARVGDTLILRGTSLAGPATHVWFGDLAVPATVVSVDRVEVEIPDDTIPGFGPIPPARQLQPGVRTAKVVLSDPVAMQGGFASNEAPFMLVPGIEKLDYPPTGPRRIVLTGSRLTGTSPGETVIGRSVVSASKYLAATPKKIEVPIPDSLPARNVAALVGDELQDPVTYLQTDLTITIGTSPGPSVSVAFPQNEIARKSITSILAAHIRDATLNDARYVGCRVELIGTRLVIISGGLSEPVSATGPIAQSLGIAGLPHPGAAFAYLSGELTAPLMLSAANPKLQLQIGGGPPVELTLPRTPSIEVLASELQAAIRGGPDQYAMVGVSRQQLLIIPGVSGEVIFSAAPGDATTVVELQLLANYAVRVRVNGAESIDSISVELPQ